MKAGLQRRRLLAVIVTVMALPLVAEPAWRIGYALRLGDASWLAYPQEHPALGQRFGIGVAAGPQGQLPVQLPQEGIYRHEEQGSFLSEIPVHAPGFRGRDLAAPPSGALRIAALGGSSTFCPECAPGETWPDRLEQRLRDGGHEVEVFNAGVMGATAAEQAWVAEHLVMPHPIDLLLVCAAYNDVPTGAVKIDLRPLVAPWHRRLLWGRSLLYTSLMQARITRGTPWKARVRAYRDAIERIVGMARERGITPVLLAQPILPPDRMDLRNAPMVQRGNQRMATILLPHLETTYTGQQELVEVGRAVAAEHQLSFIDLRQELLADPQPQRWFQLFIHPSPAGADRFATLLAPQLEPLLGPPQERADPTP